MSSKIAVLGSGAWGCALATKICLNTDEVWVWGRNSETITAINQKKHPAFPGITLPDNLFGSLDLKRTIEGSSGVMLVVPSRAFISILEKIAPMLPPTRFFSWATKGFSTKGERLLSQEVEERIKSKGVFLTGPTFAKEVIENKPTAILAAGESEKTEFWRQKLSCSTLRIYTTKDMVSAQVGAALKNIIAIAVGISDGMENGSNARAALITRGLKEMERISDHFKGKRETLYGLSGLGDVVLSSTDNESRNRRFGFLIGAKKPNHETFLSEGVSAVEEVVKIAKKNQISMPICEVVFRIIKQKEAPEQAMKALLSRPFREE